MALPRPGRDGVGVSSRRWGRMAVARLGLPQDPLLRARLDPSPGSTPRAQAWGSCFPDLPCTPGLGTGGGG